MYQALLTVLLLKQHQNSLHPKWLTWSRVWIPRSLYFVNIGRGRGCKRHFCVISPALFLSKHSLSTKWKLKVETWLFQEPSFTHLKPFAGRWRFVKVKAVCSVWKVKTNYTLTLTHRYLHTSRLAIDVWSHASRAQTYPVYQKDSVRVCCEDKWLVFYKLWGSKCDASMLLLENMNMMISICDSANREMCIFCTHDAH